jgi:hypothetical protein
MENTVSAAVLRVVTEQRKRCLASILGAAEVAPWWGRLTREEQVAYRQRVIDALGVFYDLCRDVIKVTDDEEGLRNDHAVDLIERIHATVSRRT